MDLRSTYRRRRFWQKKIVFSDEAHFELGGYVNKQTLSHLGHRKPSRIHWKADATKMSHCFITANSDRYRAILNEFLFTKIEEEAISISWFQQNDATCHKAEGTLHFLRPVFEIHIISRRRDFIWSPQSCDLTPLDYCLWGAVKDKCYADKPETIDALKDNLREAIDEIQLYTIDNGLKNWTDRRLNEIIFHY